MTEIMYSFNMKTLKKMFVPFIHKNIDGDCMAVRISFYLEGEERGKLEVGEVGGGRGGGRWGEEEGGGGGERGEVGGRGGGRGGGGKEEGAGQRRGWGKEEGVGKRGAEERMLIP